MLPSARQALALLFLFLILGCSNPEAEQARADADAKAQGARVIEVRPECRSYVSNPLWTGAAGQIFVLDHCAGEFLGLVDTGYMPAFAASHDHSRLYIAETFFARGTRGQRTDVLTIVNGRTLMPEAELVLPQTRFMTSGKKERLTLTRDGKTLLMFNLTPAQSVTLIDTAARRILGEVESPGCTLTYPLRDDHFAMICTDGTLLSVRRDGGESVRNRTAKFFDPDGDPLIDQAAYSLAESSVYFVSYEGVIHSASILEEEIRINAEWSALNAADRAAGWRVGGAQPIAVAALSERLYLLLHQGERWTHKESGVELWVFDLETKRRIERKVLPMPIDSIAIGGGRRDHLLALSSDEATLFVFDARKLQLLHQIEELGYGPALVIGGDL